ncbi:AMP-binding protein [Nocardia africana]|uniref:AMP-binding protein n=1 Tax=Nocardia africana TaxID=134964 RepID=UPI001428999D|nr:AMP-binding protein [Nocardia africana]MCC3312300.1 long-chain fatty acid--CoA ligase [Nocardia africana]
MSPALSRLAGADRPSELRKHSLAYGRGLFEPGFLWSVVANRAESVLAERVLIVGENGERVSAADAVVRAESLAAALHEEGVREDTRVAWRAGTGVDALLIMLALARLGAVQIPLGENLSDRRMRAAASAAAAEYLLIDEPCGSTTHPVQRSGSCGAARVLRVRTDACVAAKGLPAYRSNDWTPRWLFVRSGRGRTAVVKHTELSLSVAARGLVGSRLCDRPGSVGAIVLPLTEVSGVVHVAAMFAAGMSVVVLRSYEASHAVGVLRYVDAATVSGTERLCRGLLELQRALPRGSELIPALCRFVVVGDPRSSELEREAKRTLGVTVTYVYGLPEAPTICVGASGGGSSHRGATTVGPPIPGIRVRIAKNGMEVRTGVHGEIQLSGPGLSCGYLAAEDNASAFTDDGWFRTGDRGKLAFDGSIEAVSFRRGSGAGEGVRSGG